MLYTFIVCASALSENRKLCFLVFQLEVDRRSLSAARTVTNIFTGTSTAPCSLCNLKKPATFQLIVDTVTMEYFKWEELPNLRGLLSTNSQQYSRITKFTGTKWSMVYYLAVLCLSRVFLKESVEQVLYQFKHVPVPCIFIQFNIRNRGDFRDSVARHIKNVHGPAESWRCEAGLRTKTKGN